jgi:hypothetical protein
MAEKQSNEEENGQINENKEQEKELVVDIENYIKYVPLLHEPRAILKKRQKKDRQTEGLVENIESIYQNIYQNIDCKENTSSFTLEELLRVCPENENENKFESKKNFNFEDMDNFKGRVIRSSKPRGQSSKYRWNRQMKTENETNEAIVRCHLNENQFIREFWSQNYGRDPELEIVQQKQNKWTKSPKPERRSRTRKECDETLRTKRVTRRYRLEWAQSLLNFKPEGEEDSEEEN